ncbi:hypothetical protein M5689_003231 [Euphorbia peplus]|nr:hypothetical protein M5689_003231 [Euphorbia peplus]
MVHDLHEDVREEGVQVQSELEGREDEQPKIRGEEAEFVGREDEQPKISGEEAEFVGREDEDIGRKESEFVGGGDEQLEVGRQEECTMGYEADMECESVVRDDVPKFGREESEIRREEEDTVEMEGNVGGEGENLEDDDEFVDLDYNMEDDDEDLVNGVEHAKSGVRPSRGEDANSGVGCSFGGSGIDHTLDFQLEDNSSKYDDSYLLNSNSESDNELHSGRRRRYAEFMPIHDLQDPQFSIVLVFASAPQLRNALRNHDIYNRVLMSYKKNTNVKVEAICKGNCLLITCLMMNPKYFDYAQSFQKMKT